MYEEALALFLCVPQALYAVNKQVGFTPCDIRVRRVPGEHGALVTAVTLLRHTRGAGAMQVPNTSWEVA